MGNGFPRACLLVRIRGTEYRVIGCCWCWLLFFLAWLNADALIADHRLMRAIMQYYGRVAAKYPKSSWITSRRRRPQKSRRSSRRRGAPPLPRRSGRRRGTPGRREDRRQPGAERGGRDRRRGAP
jgi:hypothetical protein